MRATNAKIPYVVAEILAGVAEAEASAIGVPMVIAFVDGDGGLQLFKRMDGALPVSTELAVSKAYTAAAVREATHRIGELAQPGGVLYGIQHTHGGRIVVFGGGLPLFVRGEVVGAIGISGGSVDEDMSVANAAANALIEMERWAAKIEEWIPEQGVELLALPRVRDELQKVIHQVGETIPSNTAAVLAGSILLALA